MFSFCGLFFSNNEQKQSLLQSKATEPPKVLTSTLIPSAIKLEETDSLNISPESSDVEIELDWSILDPSKTDRVHKPLCQTIEKNYLQDPFYKRANFKISQYEFDHLYFVIFEILNNICQVLEAEKIVFFRTLTILYQVLFCDSSPKQIKHIKTYDLGILVGACFALAYCLDDDEDNDKLLIWDVLPQLIGLSNAAQLRMPMGEIWALLNYDLYATDDIYESYVKSFFKHHSLQQVETFSTYLSLLHLNPLFLEFDNNTLLLTLDRCLFHSIEIQQQLVNKDCLLKVKELVDLISLGTMPFSYLYQPIHLRSQLGRALRTYLKNSLCYADYVVLPTTNLSHAAPTNTDIDSHSSDEEDINLQCHWDISP